MMELYTGGYGKDYSNLNNNPSVEYPERTTDGFATMSVGLPSFGEMYSGNDLNYSYWLMNRWQSSSSFATHVGSYGDAGGTHAGSDWRALRPVVHLKENVKVVSGKGTMNEPYTLKI